MAGLVEVVEGDARLLVPEGGGERGPGRREGDVFYNRAMSLSRDVSLAVYRSLLPPGGSVLDGLAATGARAVRLALAGGLVAAANDWNPKAADLALENARRNGVEVEVTRRNLGALLWETNWDGVDVDPFGSPSEFVDAAARAVRRDGVVALTATDTTALYGVYPNVCERRYLATPLRAEFGHEVALRILAGFAARQAAKHDVALVPVVAHATDHYYRVYLRARAGAARADEALAGIGVAWLCGACAARDVARFPPDVCPECGGAKLRAAGPLWAGPLLDAEAVASVNAAATKVRAARPEEMGRLLGRLEEEAGAAPLYFDLHAAAARAGVDVPRTDVVVRVLRDAGFSAARTHMRRTALRTDAGNAGLVEALRAAARARDGP